MSYGEEIATEMMIEQEVAYQQHLNRLMKSLWTMEDGTVISVHDMEHQHIINCINMLHGRDDDLAKMWIERFREELVDRGESVTITITAFVCPEPKEIIITLTDDPDPFPS